MDSLLFLLFMLLMLGSIPATAVGGNSSKTSRVQVSQLLLLSLPESSCLDFQMYTWEALKIKGQAAGLDN
jgi:hypothetical protein